MKRGFTLIELLIVVAIIAILAAIAVPNFLEAQTRAKVARVKSDLRTLSSGMESYYVDNNKYPPGSEVGLGDSMYALWRLTTPVSYITDVAFKDPFTNTQAYMGNGRTALNYFCYDVYSPWANNIHNPPNWQVDKLGWRAGWCVSSYGPDRQSQAAEWYPIFLASGANSAASAKLYDATNGTLSLGDVSRFGGDLPVSQQPN